MTGYLKQFNEDHVRVALAGSPGMMLAKLQERIGCSEMTLRHLLKPLIEYGEVVKMNIGTSEKKPINIYLLKESEPSASEPIIKRWQQK